MLGEDSEEQSEAQRMNSVSQFQETFLSAVSVSFSVRFYLSIYLFIYTLSFLSHSRKKQREREKVRNGYFSFLKWRPQPCDLCVGYAPNYQNTPLDSCLTVSVHIPIICASFFFLIVFYFSFNLHYCKGFSVGKGDFIFHYWIFIQNYYYYYY